MPVNTTPQTAKPATRRVRLTREARIAEILEVARRAFIEHGADGVSVAEIANRVGIVEGAIYRFFDSKRDLLQAVLEEWYGEVMAEYEQGLRLVQGFEARLRFIIWHHADGIHRNPELTNIVLTHFRGGSSYRDSGVFEANQRYTRRLAEVLEEGVAAGALRADVPYSLVRDMIFGTIEHRTWQHRVGIGDFDPMAITDEIAGLLLNGLRVEVRATGATQEVLDRLEAVAARLEARADDEDAGATREG